MADKIFFSGITGSLGKAFLKQFLPGLKGRIVGMSRGEHKQQELEKEFYREMKDGKLDLFIGDVRDLDRLKMATKGCSAIIHAAALKVVPKGESDPIEFVKTNVGGASNIIETALHNKVQKVVALSTDKAVNPINVYGTTKSLSDRLFVSANQYKTQDGPIFSVVRYGNVIGSQGSVVPLFLKLPELKITDKRMTRFMIRIEEGLDLINLAVKTAKGGEIFVKKIPSMGIMDIVSAIPGGKRFSFIGIRPGEKLHEQMITENDRYMESENFYTILPSTFSGEYKTGFNYCSNTNNRWMSVNSLKEWIRETYSS
jgi:UDP-N-acetylglucosamine 4,6-dehydratase/5-epimerase